ncbi:MAG: hypothetical protein R3284_01690 [Rubricoccaceae bacterium]|nr:hypothetical protein [Rubricoccaceae bacterium]
MHRTLILFFILLLSLPAVGAQSDKDSAKETLETAEEVLEANLEATGGRSAWEAIQSLERTGLRINDSPMGGGKMTSTFVETIQYPGYLHNSSEMETQMGTMNIVRVITPEESWVEAGPIGRREMPLEPNLNLEGPSAELTLLTSSEFSIAGMTTDTFEGREVYVVTVDVAGVELQRYYDQSNLMLLAAERGGADGAEPELVKYGDYREVDGLLFSFEQDEEVTMRMISRDASGNETETLRRGDATVTIENIRLNPNVDTTLFSNE